MEKNRKSRLVVLACDMFVNEGVKEVRMDDIAHRAAVSKRTLYELFGDKKELLYLAMTHYLKRFDKECLSQASSAPNVLVAYLLFAKVVIKHSEQNWRVMKSLKRFFPEVSSRIREDRAELGLQAFKETLVMGVEEGLIHKSANIDLAIVMINSIVGRMAMETKDEFYISLPEGYTAQEALYEMISYFLRGISTPKGVEVIDQFIEDEKMSK